MDGKTYIVFQFHYGTIKRIRASHRPYLLWLFQFHYGTIKRIHFFLIGSRFHYFNSTMVRLKDNRLASCSRRN